MANVVPLLVSFGTGMVRRYNERKKAQNEFEYDKAIQDAEAAAEMQKIIEQNNHDFALADYNNNLRLLENDLKYQNDLKLLKEERGYTLEDMATERKYVIEDMATEQKNALALENLKNANLIKLEKEKHKYKSLENANSILNGYEVFGNGETSFKLNQYHDNSGLPKVGPEWDRKKVEDLNNLYLSPGFKDIVKAMDDSELANFKTYVTTLFQKYRISNAKRNLETGDYLAYARIKPNKYGAGAFQNLFDVEKYPQELGILEAYEDSTNYIKSLSYEQEKKKHKNVADVFLKSDEEGEFDHLMTLDDLQELYPNTPLDEVMASAEIIKAYNPELTEETGMEGNMQVIHSLRDTPEHVLAVKYTNKFAKTGNISDGQNLLNFWNTNSHAYGSEDGYVLQNDGTYFFEGTNHEARMDSLSLGILPKLIDDSSPDFVAVLDETKLEDAQKKIVGNKTIIDDLRNTYIQGTNAVNIMNNILTTYDPKYGGSPLTGGVLDLRIFLEGFTSQIGLFSDALDGASVDSIYQKIFTDNAVSVPNRDKIKTFNFNGQNYDVRTALFSGDKEIQQIAQRKFFATALNYTVSMILQGGTGGKTISDTDYEIMDRAMYNGLFTSKGLNLAALNAIYKTVRLPVALSQYKTDLSNPNAIQNMQAAMMYERLVQYNGIKQYKNLTKKLMGYAEPSTQVEVSKDDFFSGKAADGKPGRPKQKEVKGKILYYFTYPNEGVEMPMKVEDVQKHFPNATVTNYLPFEEWEDADVLVYNNQFKVDTETNKDDSQIVKDTWVYNGIVDDNQTPDVSTIPTNRN